MSFYLSGRTQKPSYNYGLRTEASGWPWLRVLAVVVEPAGTQRGLSCPWHLATDSAMSRKTMIFLVVPRIYFVIWLTHRDSVCEGAFECSGYYVRACRRPTGCTLPMAFSKPFGDE